jgi:altronate hydrolase
VVEDYTARNKGEMNNNLAGQQGGGLTTILEKSSARWPRAARPTRRGVRVRRVGHARACLHGRGLRPGVRHRLSLAAPMICFTTDAVGLWLRGHLAQVATNTALWNRQEEDIDINCGEIVDGTATVEQMGEHSSR